MSSASEGYDRPGAKRRRIALNCEECRRTKTKCQLAGRQDMAMLGLRPERSGSSPRLHDTGLRAGIGALCPIGVLKAEPSKKETIVTLQRRVAELEQLLAAAGVNTTVEATPDELSRSSSVADLQALDMATLIGRLTISDLDRRESKMTPSVDEKPSFMERPFPVPWARKGEMYTESGDISPELLRRCRSLLPGRQAAEDIFEVFWKYSSQRIQPMSRDYFAKYVVPSIYDQPDGAHPHDLAVLFGIMALKNLFEPGEHPAADFQELAWTCLVAGHFFTEITLHSLIACFLVCQFLVNSNDRRTLPGISPMISLTLRLAIIQGYHRESSMVALPEDEKNARRRIWYELMAIERSTCMLALTPISVTTEAFDTLMPVDATDFSRFKWSLGRYMGEVTQYWTGEKKPEHVLLTIDQSVRALWGRVPPELRCRALSPDAFLPDTPALEGVPTVEQYRLAQHFCMVLVCLHRPAFMGSLMSGSDRHRLSVDTIEAMCLNSVQLLESLIECNREAARWFSWSADLFTVLSCHSALVMKGVADEGKLLDRLTLLTRGVRVLERFVNLVPDSKRRALLLGSREMSRKAQDAVVGRLRTMQPLPSDNTPSILDQFGDVHWSRPATGSSSVDVGSQPELPFSDMSTTNQLWSLSNRTRLDSASLRDPAWSQAVDPLESDFDRWVAEWLESTQQQ